MILMKIPYILPYQMIDAVIYMPRICPRPLISQYALNTCCNGAEFDSVFFKAMILERRIVTYTCERFEQCYDR